MSKTDNELIAEFMGLQRDFNPAFFQINGNVVALLYDTSWDWLMPVVEKIEELLIQVSIHTAFVNLSGECLGKKWNDDFCFESQQDTKLSVTYRAAVEFIKWYNSNKQP